MISGAGMTSDQIFCRCRDQQISFAFRQDGCCGGCRSDVSYIGDSIPQEIICTCSYEDSSISATVVLILYNLTY